jgi:hypothetical protein
MPATFVRDLGSWKQVKTLHVRDAGAWKQVKTAFIRDGGVWKVAFRPTISLTIAADTTNYNIRNAATAAGWNGVDPVRVELTINPGIYVGSSSTATPALDTGIFPSGSEILITNNGTIIGRGGNGGAGGSAYGAGITAGAAGGAGGPALKATSSCAVINNGTIAGGGGGGGGGGAEVASGETNDNGWVDYYAGSGGSGGASDRYRRCCRLRRRWQGQFSGLRRQPRHKNNWRSSRHHHL